MNKRIVVPELYMNYTKYPVDKNFDENTIISTIHKFETIIKNYFVDLRKYQTDVGRIGNYYEDVNNLIENSFSEIKNEINSRLEKLLQYLKINQEKYINESNKNNNEIMILTQENNELYNKIRDLKEQIKRMERTIGENENIILNSI